MKKAILYIIIYSFFPLLSFSQVVRLGENFTKVSVIQDKVTFVKEIPMKKGASKSDNYKILKNWAADNYGRDPFISSIRYDASQNQFIAKSRIELLLPVNSKGVREKMIMRYRINGFLTDDKCVLEIMDVSYLYENSKNNKLLPHIMRAEDFITDNAIAISDNLQEYKVNTRKSTLFFLNGLSNNLEGNFGY